MEYLLQPQLVLAPMRVFVPEFGVTRGDVALPARRHSECVNHITQRFGDALKHRAARRRPEIVEQQLEHRRISTTQAARDYVWKP